MIQFFLNFNLLWGLIIVGSVSFILKFRKVPFKPFWESSYAKANRNKYFDLGKPQDLKKCMKKLTKQVHVPLFGRKTQGTFKFEFEQILIPNQFLFYFLAFDFCRFCMVIRFFSSRHNGQ